MKTKLFLAAMAAVAVIGCQKEPAGSIVNLDGDASYLKVDFNAAGSLTKALNAAEDFEYGEETENSVSSIHFYFFDSAGAPYIVTPDEHSYLKLVKGVNWHASADETQNVERISDAVLVIKRSAQAPPAKMVVVLNGTDPNSNPSLNNLHNDIAGYANETGNFIMSNSVYVDGGVAVDATPIVNENIFAANELYDEKGNKIEVGSVLPDQKVYSDANKSAPVAVTPVDIYVERVAAKVRVSVKNGIALENTTLIPVDETFNGAPVYAKILGWGVTNVTETAPLIKNIDTTWDPKTLGFTWNDPARYRSYWAKTTADPKHNLTFAEIAGITIGDNGSYTYRDKYPTSAYYMENTGAAADGNGVDVDKNLTDGNLTFENTQGQGDANKASQLLVAAQLVDASGSPLQIAKWYGVQYTISDLKTAMVAMIANDVWVATGNTNEYRTITVDDVVFYQRAQSANDNRYEVLVGLKPNTQYYKNVNNTIEKDVDNVNAKTLVEGLDPAQMWNKGLTYYYTNIRHYGYVESAENQPAGAYGMVRNHVYDVQIDAITGFGTPVYDPTHIITPEKPEKDVALNLSARINILSWHLVSQNVTLN